MREFVKCRLGTITNADRDLYCNMLFRLFILFWGLVSAYALPAQLLLPINAPEVQVNWHAEEPSCEYMFLEALSFQQNPQASSTNFILDARGDVVWAFSATSNMFDFKVHPHGKMTFFINGEFLVMDSTFNLVDAYVCKNGLRTDLHDIILRDNGNAMLICIEEVITDLSSLFTQNGAPGDSNGRVFATVIQEQDAQKNVVKDWRAFPHFDLTDSDSLQFLQPNILELNHTNSLDMTPDGYLLMSHRSNSEVTALNWSTDQIMWRLGGPNNEFSFVNDMGISNQHDARFVSPTKITVFDNGNYHQPHRSRGLIYTLDTVNMTATRTQEWYAPAIASDGMGSFQLLPNGDALLNYGRYEPRAAVNVRYFRADSTLVMDLKMEDNYHTYQANCLALPFSIPRPQIICSSTGNQVRLELAQSHASYRWSNGATTASITVTDTGRYQVLVPYGIGFVGSEVIHITDLTAPCTAVGAAEAVDAPKRSPRLIGVYDLMCRPVRQREKGVLYLERYDNGHSRKVIQR